jgi:hypothetical protein
VSQQLGVALTGVFGDGTRDAADHALGDHLDFTKRELGAALPPGRDDGVSE